MTVEEFEKKEFYIIKRIPYDYDGIPQYLDVAGGFTRFLRVLKVFDNIEDASDLIRDIKKSVPESKDYTYEIVTM